MAYSAWSVVFGEQPSASKWNILGTNDAHFNTLLGYSSYCFRAYDSGGTTLTDGNVVKINLATEVYDYNNNFSGSTYTAPIAGVYNFSGAVQINGAVSTGVDMYISIYVGGVANSQGSRVVAGSDLSLGISADTLLAANDTVELYFYQNSAGNEATVALNSKTWFAGHLVHPI